MWNLIKMEFSTLKLNIDRKHLLLITIIPLVWFRFFKNIEFEAFYIVLSFYFTILMSHYIIGTEEPESHYLINSLPISKSRVILAKYIFIHLCLLVAWVYLAVYLSAMRILEFKDLDINYLQTSMILSIIILNAMVSIINGSKFIGGIINIIILVYSLRFLTDFEVINRLSKYKMYILILTLLSIAISLALSIYLYNKREFARR